MFIQIRAHSTTQCMRRECVCVEAWAPLLTYFFSRCIRIDRFVHALESNAQPYSSWAAAKEIAAHKHTPHYTVNRIETDDFSVCAHTFCWLWLFVVLSLFVIAVLLVLRLLLLPMFIWCVSFISRFILFNWYGRAVCTHYICFLLILHPFASSSFCCTHNLFLFLLSYSLLLSSPARLLSGPIDATRKVGFIVCI